MNGQWNEVRVSKPESNIEVIGFSAGWKDEDLNPSGIRACFIEDSGRWLSARWNNYHDCYELDDETDATHWMPLPKPPE